MTAATKSRENRPLTKAESILWTADLTGKLEKNETATSVVSVAETTALGLTVGAGTINTGGSITYTQVDPDTGAETAHTALTRKAVQFRVSAASATPGEAEVRVAVGTSDGNTKTLDCRITVVT